MHTRRKFLIQGSMATTAMLALKPLKTVASTVSRLTGYNGNSKLIFLHTAIPVHKTNPAMIQQVSSIGRGNAIVLNAGVAQQFETNPLTYDSCIDEINDQTATAGGYKIINKGNIKTGIISAKPGESNVIEKVNTLSAWLKKEKGCTVVVCLSQLGYKNKNATDDITMARESINLDLIIGGNIKNFHSQPVILLNNKNEEVIIHAAAGDAAGFGKIDIDFNELGQKKHICFTNN
ncbi:MAG: hypothetical protein ABIN74_07110 [Ferruginibacter sp.]